MKKFVIIEQGLILGEVDFHNELVNKEAKVKGGGSYHIDHEALKVYLFGRSSDFGSITEQDLISVLDREAHSNALKGYNFYFSQLDELPKVLIESNHKKITKSKIDVVEVIFRQQTPKCEEISLDKLKESETIEEIKQIVLWLEGQRRSIGVAFNQVSYKGERSKIRGFYNKLNKEIYINPKILAYKGPEFETKEYCLTWPTTTLIAKRYLAIEVSYFNLQGEEVVKTLNKELAHLFQHEIDHLDGVEEKALNNDSYITKPISINRNDECPCGSGKKFKRCCINSQLISR